VHAFTQFIYQRDDFTIILICTSSLVLSGLLLYWLCGLIFSRFKIKEDPYYGVTIIGTALSLTALLLIFTLMQAMGIVNQTHKMVVTEVESLYKVKSACLLVSANECAAITNALDHYVRAILSSDWPKPPDHDTQGSFEGVVVCLRDMIRKNPSDSVERQNLLVALDTMIKARHERMLNTGKEIPKAFFGATFCLLTSFVLFFYFLAPKNRFSQLALALLLSFNGTLLGLVIVYDHPYEGDSGITQAEFQPTLEALLKR
jgi:hypothetical protein